MPKSLKRVEWIKVAKGAGIAGLGAALTYASEWASGQDFGAWTPLVTAALSVLANFVRMLAHPPVTCRGDGEDIPRITKPLL